MVTRPLGVGRVAAQSGVFWLLGSAFIALGTLVFLMKPFAGPSIAFLNLCVGLGLMVTYFAPSSRFDPPWLDRVALLVVPLLPASLLHLAGLFPRRRLSLARWRWLVPPYLLSLSLAAASLLLARKAADVPKPLLTTIYLYLLTAVLVFLGSTHQVYWRSKSSSERLQALVILTGLAVAFIAPVFELVSNLVLRVSFFPSPMLFFLLFLLAFPLSIGYAIVQHDLFEIDVIVRRTYGYLLTTGLVVALYATTVPLLNLLLGPSEIARSPVFVIGFVLAVLVLIQPVQGRIQRFVDRAFYRARSDYQNTIAEVADRMTSLLDPVLVRQTLLHAAVDGMFLENGVLLAPAGAGRAFSVSSRLGVGGPEQQAELEDALLERLRGEQQPVFRHEVELAPRYEGVRERLQRCLDVLASEVLIPMVYQGSLQGVLSLGRKKSGRMFVREDVVLLRTLAAQGSVALENARLFDDLAESLKQVQLLETVKGVLSRFVPNTVRQLIESSPDAGAALEKRERDLTVMFADMTGYTRLSSQLPLDEVNAIVERYFGAFLVEILNQGGDVNETAGDGLMVLFRSDDPGEHARAAVRAALGIQRITRAINAEREGQIPIGLHIGINSGIASVGATKIQAGDGSRWTYTASGPTTNIAARVGELGHEIAITEETQRRLDRRFPLEDLGIQALKNVTAPVRTFRVLVPEERPAA